ncbi:metalloprotease PmbA [Elongatibacter sediminis]|uniref:Metalloprotease PmbA n=1 Tax=Elongatibacter sediminis TaxID=3119006 RepID=A0AAW9RLM5_9GAMM
MKDSNMVEQDRIDREAELDTLQTHVEHALARATRGGATAAEVSAHGSQGLAVSVRKGEVETLEHMRDRSVSITVYLGRCKGHATCADLERESIDTCVDRALDIARYTQEDPCNGLADAALMADSFPDLDLWHPAELDARAAIERALACEAAGRDVAGITNSEGANFEAGLGLSVYGNSHGFIGRSAGTRFSQSCVLVAGAGDGMQRDYSYDSRRNLADLEPVEETGAEAARRTLARLGARQLPTGHMPVLLSAEVAKGFIGHLVGAISGSTLYRNASFLKDCAGERLFPEWMHIAERPRLPRGAGSAVFDSEGVATRARDIVSGGVLQGYVLSSYSARRLGLETTGNAGGVRNLLVEPGGRGGDDPVSGMQDGFYVTEVMGQGVSLVTGDYSRGASGFRVENGRIGHAVEEVTIAGNLRDLFLAIEGVSRRLDTRGNIHTGDLLIGRMMVAGS